MLQFYTLFLTRVRTYKLASPPQNKVTSKDDIKGLVSSKFLHPWLYISGISTYLTLTDQFFSAVGSLTEVKRQFINSFVSGTGGEEFLLRAQGGGAATTTRTYGTVLCVH